MPTSVFELFKIGIGPSSSHTVGPMKAARSFALAVEGSGRLPGVAALQVELLGSLGATGRGHGADRAVVLGLREGRSVEVDPDASVALWSRIRERGRLRPPADGRPPCTSRSTCAFTLSRSASTPPVSARALDGPGRELLFRTYFSVGGGFVVEEWAPIAEPRPFRSARELLTRCVEADCAISAVVRANEEARRPAAEVEAGLLRIWRTMAACVDRGAEPRGPCRVAAPRRAGPPALLRHLESRRRAGRTRWRLSTGWAGGRW